MLVGDQHSHRAGAIHHEYTPNRPKMHTSTALGTAERGNHILSSGRQKRPMGRSCGFSPHHGHYRTLAEWALNSAQWLQPWALPPHPRAAVGPALQRCVSVLDLAGGGCLATLLRDHYHLAEPLRCPSLGPELRPTGWQGPTSNHQPGSVLPTGSRPGIAALLSVLRGLGHSPNPLGVIRVGT